MTRWKDALPPSQEDNPRDRFAAALEDLAAAMGVEGRDTDSMMACAMQAAAEIRAWRKSVPNCDQGRTPPRSWYGAESDRQLLSCAARNLLTADEYGDPPVLSTAETALRVLWERHR